MRRLWITVSISTFYLWAQSIPVPGIDLSIAGRYAIDLYALEGRLVTLVIGFLFVELVALCHPGWRRLRISGADGRRILTRAAIIVALLLAAIQAFNVAQFVEDLPSPISLWEPWIFQTTTMIIFICAIGLLYALTQIIDRFGLGNGFSVLILCSVLPEIGDFAATGIGATSGGVLSPAQVLFIVIVLGSLVKATAMVLLPKKGSKPLATESTARLELPVCGIIPFEVAITLIILPETLVNFGLPLRDLVFAMTPGHTTQIIALVLLTAIFTPLFAYLFNQPKLVAAVHRTTGEVTTGKMTPRGRLIAATIRSGLYLIVLVFASALIANIAPALDPPDILVIIISTAILLDLRREWQARGKLGDLVEVWPIHRVYAAAPMLETLRAAGIPATTSGLHHRAMLQLFGPHIPIKVLVPIEHVERAREELRAFGAKPI